MSLAQRAGAPCDCCGADDWHPLFDENGFTLGSCARCDLHYVDHIPAMETRMTEMEEGHFAGEEQVVDAQKHLGAERLREGHFARYLDLARRHTPEGRWLDIGCGAGLLLRLAQQSGYEVEGIELTPDRRAVAAELTGATIHAAPVEDLRLPDGSFDVISLINVFSHLVSPTRTLAELRRLLRPGGLLLMATGEILPGAKHGDMFNWSLGDHLHWLGERTMDAYAGKLSLDVLTHDRVWLIDEMYTREWAQMKGRSPLKNALKTTVAAVPGALPLVRAVMRRRQADSSVYSGTFALRPTASP